MNSKDMLKIKCAKAIAKVRRESGMLQGVFAGTHRLNPSDVSQICNGRLKHVKVDRLITILETLGYSCEITIRKDDGSEVEDCEFDTPRQKRTGFKLDPSMTLFPKSANSK